MIESNNGMVNILCLIYINSQWLSDTNELKINVLIKLYVFLLAIYAQKKISRARVPAGSELI